MKTDKSAKIQKAKNIQWKTVNGEAILLRASGDYYALDAVGTFLWTKISQDRLSLDDLLNCLMAEYNCNSIQAENDVTEFCNGLIAEKLLDVNAV